MPIVKILISILGLVAGRVAVIVFVTLIARNARRAWRWFWS